MATVLPRRAKVLYGFVCALGFCLGGMSLASGDEPKLGDLVNRTVDVELAKRYYPDAVVSDVVQTKGMVTALAVRVDDKVQTISASQIAEIFVDGQPLDVAFNREKKALGHSPEKRTARLEYEKRVGEKLKKQSLKLWPRLTTAEMQAACEENLAHLAEVREKWPNLPLKVYETRYYQVSSDLPGEDIERLLVRLDALYDSLCDGFGIPQGKNIWRGKCVVHAFREKAGYMAFEQAYYNNDGATKDGRAHSNNKTGRVIVNMYRLEKFDSFVGLLTHETTHGFLHRYRSNAGMPGWLNEGISDWAAGAVVPQWEAPRRKQLHALDYIKLNRTVPEEFFGPKPDISGWKYGMGTHLAVFLSKQSSKKYRGFIDGMKEGTPWQEALQENYGWTTDELLTQYGKSVGVPQLRIGPPSPPK